MTQKIIYRQVLEPLTGHAEHFIQRCFCVTQIFNRSQKRLGLAAFPFMNVARPDSLIALVRDIGIFRFRGGPILMLEDEVAALATRLLTSLTR